MNGARGNSGVILSQILRGIAEVTATAAAASGAVLRAVDANALGAALWRGVELVVASMGGVEVPGTIVSVLRAAAGAVDQCAHEGLAGAVTAAGDAAVIALEKTPEQLDVLADAGAVDAGGRGLLVLLDALALHHLRAGTCPGGLRTLAARVADRHGYPTPRPAIRGDVSVGGM